MNAIFKCRTDQTLLEIILIDLKRLIQSRHKFCHLCELIIGPESKHCFYCNRCVSDYDHHCVVLLTCIQNDNIYNFLTMLVCFTIGGSLGLILFGLNIYENNNPSMVYLWNHATLMQFILFFLDKCLSHIFIPIILMQFIVVGTIMSFIVLCSISMAKSEKTKNKKLFKYWSFEKFQQKLFNPHVLNIHS